MKCVTWKEEKREGMDDMKPRVPVSESLVFILLFASYWLNFVLLFSIISFRSNEGHLISCVCLSWHQRLTADRVWDCFALPAAGCLLLIACLPAAFMRWSSFPGVGLGVEMICGHVRDRLNHEEDVSALTSSAAPRGLAVVLWCLITPSS